MNLADDLLEQATLLAGLDPKKPKQANLRRAVSTAYYALFHLLVDEAVSFLLSDEPLRAMVSRTLEHQEMLVAAKAFAKANLPKQKGQTTTYVDALCKLPIRDELVYVANTFIDLQSARHAADYKRHHPLKRSDVRKLVHQAEQSFQKWRLVRGEPETRVFLAALVFCKRWKSD